MAYTKEGFLGPFKGRIGKVVFYEMYGKTVGRSLPSVKRKPAKGALKESQNDFARVMKIMQKVKPFVRLGFKDMAEGRSAFHTALSENLKRYRLAENREELTWLCVSKGERAGALDLTLNIEGKVATVSWGEPEPRRPFAPNDRVMLLAFNPATIDSNYDLHAATRAEGTATLILPPAKEEENMLVFISFLNATGMGDKKNLKNISDSQLVGLD
ncbi:MAG: hypothetical protein K0B09_07065 [Bacteroidales bacterium]|nr:hypothetical protein [Bacteroidales bacterium]